MVYLPKPALPVRRVRCRERLPRQLHRVQKTPSKHPCGNRPCPPSSGKRQSNSQVRTVAFHSAAGYGTRNETANSATLPPQRRWGCKTSRLLLFVCPLRETHKQVRKPCGALSEGGRICFSCVVFPLRRAEAGAITISTSIEGTFSFSLRSRVHALAPLPCRFQHVFLNSKSV